MVSLALLCASGAASTSWVPTIEQKLPLFHDLSSAPSGSTSDSDAIPLIKLESDPESTSSDFHDWLVKYGILYPKKKTILSINNPCTEGETTTPSWKFPKGHYLPDDTAYEVDKISVTAWRSFPVTVSVKCKGEDNFKTETILVTVE